ncbi:hypothetical protein ABT369_57410 [Dactylosporangium sp. NPDC000244]|uniref:hypothetical protein n=1 Tax=Dactylosporangium sp. NPDC000244 TaxID=3154365 RepID=UPI003329F361
MLLTVTTPVERVDPVLAAAISGLPEERRFGWSARLGSFDLARQRVGQRCGGEGSTSGGVVSCHSDVGEQTGGEQDGEQPTQTQQRDDDRDHGWPHPVAVCADSHG